MYQSSFKFDGQLSVETAIQKGHLKKNLNNPLVPPINVHN